MASTTDPRGAGFSASAFRDAITFVMQMGMPDSTTQQATFQWRVIKDFAIADHTENPYDWTATPLATTTHDDVTIPVAIEFSANTSSGTQGNSEGNFENPYAVLTVLDTYYPQIQGANIVLLGTNEYVIRYTEPPIGLFEVTVYRIHTQALDES